MIDLTPVEIRNKADDFDRGFRGFDPGQVESYLDMVADRLEELQQQNRELEAEVEKLREDLEEFEEREEALNEALLTAQELREESRAQAEREASLTVREAEAQAEAIEREAERGLDAARDKLDELRSRRAHFLRSFRALLEGYLAEVEVEQDRIRGDEEELPPAEEISAEPDPEPPAVDPEAYRAPDSAADGERPPSGENSAPGEDGDGDDAAAAADDAEPVGEGGETPGEEPTEEQGQGSR